MPKWEELGPEYPGVRVQVAQVGGRQRIVGIQVQDPEGVTHDRIRSLPVSGIEAKLNEGAAMRFELPSGGWPPPKRHELHLRKDYFENPDGRGYGDELYNRVAMLYTRCVAGGVRPAKAISEANDVPVSTVHRWIREARRRGHLAPSRGPGAQG